jgi:hypothetical protein
MRFQFQIPYALWTGHPLPPGRFLVRFVFSSVSSVLERAPFYRATLSLLCSPFRPCASYWFAQSSGSSSPPPYTSTTLGFYTLKLEKSCSSEIFTCLHIPEPDSASCLFLIGSSLSLLLEPEDGVSTFLQDMSSSTALHGVTSEMAVLFIVTVVRTSNAISHGFIRV